MTLRLRCPHCHHDLDVGLVATVAPQGKAVYVATVPPKPKPKVCACGHDAHEGKCRHGEGTAFGGCTCPGMHSRRRGGSSTKKPESEKGELSKGERAVLAVLVQYATCSKQLLRVTTGFKRSTLDTYLRRLSASGHAEGLGDEWGATPSGRKELGPFEAPPTGSKLLAQWLEKLPEGESTLLDCLAACYPLAASGEQISEATGYKRSTRDTYLRRLSARKLVVRTDEGLLASPLLFDNGGAS